MPNHDLYEHKKDWLHLQINCQETTSFCKSLLPTSFTKNGIIVILMHCKNGADAEDWIMITHNLGMGPVKLKVQSWSFMISFSPKYYLSIPGSIRIGAADAGIKNNGNCIHGVWNNPCTIVLVKALPLGFSNKPYWT